VKEEAYKFKALSEQQAVQIKQQAGEISTLIKYNIDF